MSNSNEQYFPALKAAAIYAIFGGLWILLSDKVLNLLVTDMDTYAAIQTYKGWAYIFITALLVFKVFHSYAKESMAVQEQLRIQEERHKLAMRNSNIGTWDWDIENGDAIFNEEYTQMLGYDVDNFPPIYESWEATLHPDDKDEALERLAAHFSGETEEYVMEFRMLTSEKKWKWILGRGKVCSRGENGRPLRMVGTHMDLTQQKKLHQELENAKETAEAVNVTREHFLANMGHEIRTPLNSMLGMLRLMRDGNLPPEQREYLASAEASGHSLLEVINELVSQTQIDANSTNCKEDLNLMGITESISRIFRSQFDHLGITLFIDIDPTIPTDACGDQDRLRQILFNLVSSALQFSPQEDVVIRAQKVRDQRDPKRLHILFTVSDSSSGLTSKELETIFDPFARISESENLGTGLRIAGRMINAMGGSMCVDSSTDEGTVVSFCITVVSPSTRQESVQTDASITATPLLRVLLVEDDPINRIVARRFLEKLGHSVKETFNGAEALDVLKDENFDCVLMDIRMPVMNGLEATDTIRHSSTFLDKASIPVIATTAHNIGDDTAILEAGFDGIVTKPISLEVLDAELRRVAANYRKNQD